MQINANDVGLCTLVKNPFAKYSYLIEYTYISIVFFNIPDMFRSPDAKRS